MWDWTTTERHIPVAVDTSAWGSKKIVSISWWLYNGLFLDEDWKVYSVWRNNNGQLWDWTTTERHIPVAVDSSTWNPAVIWQPIAWTWHFPLGTWFDESNKPYRSFPWIGEWQILKIESDHPITVYYGLGSTPAIAELISPNSQDFYYPILADEWNFVDYNTQMYTYYDLNLAKIQDYQGHILKSGTINIWDDISVWIPNKNLITHWNKWVSTGPVWLAVWNKSASYNYMYPIKSSKKLYGIWNQYLFNNVNANKLVIIADNNDWNNVDVIIKKDGTQVDSFTLSPKQEKDINIDANSFYSIETDDVDKYVYLYAQKWDNVRNTFSTIFKSRTNLQLGNKIIKNDIWDKYLKYDLMWDFDFIIDEPISTGEINIKWSQYNPTDSNNPEWVLTNITLAPKQKFVLNWVYSKHEATPNDLQIDDFTNWKYINWVSYKTELGNNTDYNEGSFFTREDEAKNNIHYTWGWIINQSDTKTHTYKIAVKDTDFSDNWPNVIYKKYAGTTYFPKISWTPLYDFIKATWNKLNISLDWTDYFSKRNLSDKPFDLTYNNWTINVKTTANSNEFTDTYYIPIIRKIDDNTLDYVELNKITTLEFDRTWDKLWVICATVEDNNKVVKNICYTSQIGEGKLRTDLTNVWRIKNIDDTKTTHKRNLYSDYVKIFNDWTKPMKLLGLEFTWIKRKDFTSTFSNISVNNYTSVNPALFFKPNENIFSPDTPLSHSLKIWIMDIKRWSKIFDAANDDLDITLPNSNEKVNNDNFTFNDNGIDYSMTHIKDLDLLNSDMDESEFKPSRLYQLEEKHDYVLFFRARWFGLKEIKLVSDDDSHTYIDSIFTPRQYTWNMINIAWKKVDKWDLYSLTFKTSWDENDKVKVKFINHNWDAWISNIYLLRLDDSDFKLKESVLQWDWTTVETALPNTWKIPVYLAKNKKGNVKWEIIYKNISYYKKNNNNWIGDIDNKEDLENKIVTFDSDDTISKIYSYPHDKNVLNFLDGWKYKWVAVEDMTTNVYSEKNQTFNIRIWLVWSIKLNWNYIYSNLKNEHLGCLTWTWNYTNYNTDNIKEDNCLVRIPFKEWNNILEISSVVNNSNNAIKWFYKDTSFNLTSLGSGFTSKELLTYDTEPWMPINVESFNPYNTNLDNAISIAWQSAIIWLTTKQLSLLSVQNIDRDYSLKEIPTILNTTTNRNKDIKDVDRLVEIGLWKKVTIDEGTRIWDHISTNTFIPDWKVSIKTTTKASPIWLNSWDIIEAFVQFPHKPKQFDIELDNWTKTQNIFWWDNYMFTEEVDGINIIKEWEMTDLSDNTWYKIYIPVKWTILEWQNLNKLNFHAFGWDINISDITVLKDKLLKEWNNVRITFDLDILPETQKRDIIFWLTTNSSLLEDQGYQVKFSKNGSTTEILKNWTVIWTVSNSESYIKEWINRYKLMFVKNKNHLYFSIKYDFVDPADGIYKTKVTHLLDVIDNTPLNLKNSHLLFNNNNNKYRVSNIRVEDGEDNEKIWFLKFDSINDNYSNWTITLYNDQWDVDSTAFSVYDNIEKLYTSLKSLSSYKWTLTDVVIKPNKSTTTDNTYRIKEVSLIKGSETPAIISWNSHQDKMWIAMVKNWSKVSEVFTNNKDYIMWYTVFVSKPSTLEQPEWLTLRMYEADSNGEPKKDWSWNPILLVEKTVNTDWVKASPNITPLKIVFPQIAVVHDKDYIFELSTTNSQWLYIYWTNYNTFKWGYATITKKEKPYVWAFEFNEFWDRVYWEKGWIWYLGSTLWGTDIPDRKIISWDNLSVVAHKANNSTITITDDNINLRYNATFIFRWKFTPSNWTWWPLLIEKQEWGSINWRTFWFYIDKTQQDNLHYSIVAADWTKIIQWVTNFPITWSDTTIALSVSTETWKAKIYKDWVLKETITLPAEAIWKPFVKVQWFKFFWQHWAWTWDQELDYFRVYDKVLDNNEIIEASKPVNEYTTRLPYDIAYFLISKSNDIETIAERTYDLGDGIIYEVEWDLMLNWYDAGDGIKRLILKWNSTFRVKWNIYINADEVLVINDNWKEWDDAISYIWFVTDNDIIIWKNVSFIQWWYFAKGSIKTELSRKQLKINWLLAWNEIDLQNRVYLKPWEVCSIDQKENCSVVVEYDKRIYKKTPPLFYNNNNDQAIQIVEE